MKTRLFVIGTLLLSGLLALAAGASILIDPREFYSSLGIVIDDQIGLANEMRAAGGFILVVGLLALSSMWASRFAFTALFVAGLLNGSFGATRIYSFALDGIPNNNFLLIASLELIIAALCFSALGVASKNGFARLFTARNTSIVHGAASDQ